MKLTELVKLTDFKKYYFVIDAYHIKARNINRIDVSLKNGGTYFELNDYCLMDDRTYDLGKALFCGTCADWVAYVIDKSKLFVIDYIEHDGDIAYIHLYLKKN